MKLQQILSWLKARPQTPSNDLDGLVSPSLPVSGRLRMWSSNTGRGLSRRRRVRSSLEALEVRENLSVVLIVITSQGFWLVENPGYDRQTEGDAMTESQANSATEDNYDDRWLDSIFGAFTADLSNATTSTSVALETADSSQSRAGFDVVHESLNDTDPTGSDAVIVVIDEGLSDTVSPASGPEIVVVNEGVDDTSISVSVAEIDAVNEGVDGTDTTELFAAVDEVNEGLDVTASSASSEEIDEVNELLDWLFANSDVSNADVLSLRLIKRSGIRDLAPNAALFSAEDDSSDETRETGEVATNAPANSSSSRAVDQNATGSENVAANTTSAAATNVVVSRTDNPSSVPSPNDSKELANAVSADHPSVARRSTNVKDGVVKSAADARPDNVPAHNSPATSLDAAADGALETEDEEIAAYESSLVANLDRLFSSFQAELADATGSASGLWYVRTGNMSGDMLRFSERVTDGVTSGGLSYAQWVSLASVLGLGSGALLQASQRSSRDQEGRHLPAARLRR